jgi:hypothetical protein
MFPKERPLRIVLLYSSLLKIVIKRKETLSPTAARHSTVESQSAVEDGNKAKEEL